MPGLTVLSDGGATDGCTRDSSATGWWLDAAFKAASVLQTRDKVGSLGLGGISSNPFSFGTAASHWVCSVATTSVCVDYMTYHTPTAPDGTPASVAPPSAREIVALCKLLQRGRNVIRTDARPEDIEVIKTSVGSKDTKSTRFLEQAKIVS